MVTPVKKYSWKNSSMMKGDPQQVGERLEELKVKQRGMLLPEDLVKDARGKSSPLHECFTWDDNEAAKACRLLEARKLLRSLTVTVIVSRAPASPPTRAYVCVNTNDDPQDKRGCYVSTEDGIKDPVWRKKIVLRALDELISWRSKYERFEELAPVFEALKAVKLNVQRDEKDEKTPVVIQAAAAS
jgi:hypothetical protein